MNPRLTRSARSWILPASRFIFIGSHLGTYFLSRLFRNLLPLSQRLSRFARRSARISRSTVPVSSRADRPCLPALEWPRKPRPRSIVVIQTGRRQVSGGEGLREGASSEERRKGEERTFNVQRPTFNASQRGLPGNHPTRGPRRNVPAMRYPRRKTPARLPNGDGEKSAYNL